MSCTGFFPSSGIRVLLAVAALSWLAAGCGQQESVAPPTPPRAAPSPSSAAPAKPEAAQAPLRTTTAQPPTQPAALPSVPPAGFRAMLQSVPADAAHYPAKGSAFAQPASPAPAGFTASPEIECYGNVHTLGVIATLPAGLAPGDIDAMRAFLNVAGEWQPMHDLVQVGATSHFATSIFWLTPETAYQVKVVVEHPPGTVTKTWYGQGQTRPVAVVPETAQALYVSPQGSDSAAGTAELPYKTIAAALARAEAGCTIFLKGGVYYEGDLSFTHNGAAGRPLVLRSAPGEIAVLDGSNPDLSDPAGWKKEAQGLYSHAYEGKSYNVVLEDRKTGKLTRLIPIFTAEELRNRTVAKHGDFAGSTFAKEEITGAFATDGKTAWLLPPAPLENFVVHIARATKGLVLEKRNHIVFNGLTLRYYGKEDYSGAALVYESSDILFDHCQFAMVDTGVWIKGQSDRVTVQHCAFVDDLNLSPFGMVKVGGNPASFEAGAINIDARFSGRGLIVWDNHIEKLFDGVHLTSWKEDKAATNEVDFYENTVLDCVDDFIEADGFSRNVRIFDNYMRRSLSGISVAQALDGPTFVLYNVIADCGRVPATTREGNGSYPFKTNGGDGADVGSGPIFFYHNTAYTTDPESRAMMVKRPTWRKITFRNNLWVGQKMGFDCWKNPPSPMDFDYDNLFCVDKTQPLVVLAYKTKLTGLKEVRETMGWLQHGISAEPNIVDPQTGIYTLQADSPCIDAGVIVPGINKGRMKGAAPDMGAFEAK